MSKSLIIYFSRADENYAVGYIDKGNTEIVAEYMQELTGADMFKVEPLVPPACAACSPSLPRRPLPDMPFRFRTRSPYSQAAACSGSGPTSCARTCPSPPQVSRPPLPSVFADSPPAFSSSPTCMTETHRSTSSRRLSPR